MGVGPECFKNALSGVRDGFEFSELPADYVKKLDSGEFGYVSRYVGSWFRREAGVALGVIVTVEPAEGGGYEIHASISASNEGRRRYPSRKEIARVMRLFGIELKEKPDYGDRVVHAYYPIDLTDDEFAGKVWECRKT